MIAHGWQLAPVTSLLVGEVASRAQPARREGGVGSAESNKHPPPHPSPTSKSDVSDLDPMGRVWPYLGALFLALIVVALVPWLSVGFL
jgi:hypothetical protein